MNSQGQGADRYRLPARGERGSKMHLDDVQRMGAGAFSLFRDENVKPSLTRNSPFTSLVLSDVLSYDEPAHLITWSNI